MSGKVKRKLEKEAFLLKICHIRTKADPCPSRPHRLPSAPHEAGQVKPHYHPTTPVCPSRRGKDSATVGATTAKRQDEDIDKAIELLKQVADERKRMRPSPPPPPLSVPSSLSLSAPPPAPPLRPAAAAVTSSLSSSPSPVYVRGRRQSISRPPSIGLAALMESNRVRSRSRSRSHAGSRTASPTGSRHSSGPGSPVSAGGGRRGSSDQARRLERRASAAARVSLPPSHVAGSEVAHICQLRVGLQYWCNSPTRAAEDPSGCTQFEQWRDPDSLAAAAAELLPSSSSAAAAAAAARAQHALYLLPGLSYGLEVTWYVFDDDFDNASSTSAGNATVCEEIHQLYLLKVVKSFTAEGQVTVHVEQTRVSTDVRDAPCAELQAVAGQTTIVDDITNDAHHPVFLKLHLKRSPPGRFSARLTVNQFVVIVAED